MHRLLALEYEGFQIWLEVDLVLGRNDISRKSNSMFLLRFHFFYSYHGSLRSGRMPQMDKVFIEGLRLSGKHGVAEHERTTTTQDFMLDVAAELDTGPAAKGDDI